MIDALYTKYVRKSNRSEPFYTTKKKSMDTPFIQNSNSNPSYYTRYPFYETTIIARKRIDKFNKLHNRLMHYYGVGKVHSTWFTSAVGNTQNTMANSTSRRSIHVVDQYITTDPHFHTDKKKIAEQKAYKKRLWSLFSYHTVRRKKGLPIRGQRTKTNARTAKRLHRM